MKILVTGGAGYIGSALVPKLLEHGYKVDVVDLLWFGNYLPKEVNVAQKDLFQIKAKDLEGYDQVIFLAGLSNDPMAEFCPDKNFIYNGALPSYLAFNAKKAGVKRYIYASSCSVYGHAYDKDYTEEDEVNCNYPYGISKLQGERGALQMHDKNFSAIALRQGTVCGFSPRMRFDLIVNTMFKNALLHQKIVINNPAIWRPVYDIRDTVAAFIRAVQVDYSISGKFNVCSGNFTVGQVGDMVKEKVEKITGQTVKIENKNIEDYRNYRVNCTKAEKVLGFVPEHTIADIIDHLFEHQDYYGNFDKDEFYNIITFKKLKI